MTNQTDIEDLVYKKVTHLNSTKLLSNIDVSKLTNFVIDISKIKYISDGNHYFHDITKSFSKTYKFRPKKAQISFIYKKLLFENKIQKNLGLEKCLITKKMRSLSGVVVVTVMTTPGEFSCKHDCYYCPNEPGQPRSYVSNESLNLRAGRHNFDIIGQFHERCSTYSINGHPVDKIEVIVAGGTWSNYPLEYQIECIRDIYYAANTFYDLNKRDKLSLLDEQTINESSPVKIIGLSVETRPDCIDKEELERYITYGITKVQIGLQSTNDNI